jgi:voltage-gated sodium channel
MTTVTEQGGNWRTRVRDVVEGPRIQRLIMSLIVLNAVTLGLETSATVRSHAGGFLHAVDLIVLAVFVAEIAAKLVGRGWSFFRNGWNVFDFIIVGIALMPSAGPFSVLRALRILRVLRLLSVVPKMRQVIESLLRAVPGIATIAAILVLIFYVFAVIATNLFGPDFDEWFGTVGASMYSLFQIMTLESWSMGIVRPVMKVFPYAWAFFVPFILIATFTMLNLFIAIIVSAMQEQTDADHREEMEAIEEAHVEEQSFLKKELGRVHGELAEIRTLLARRDDGGS